MNVIVSNRQKEIIDNANIDAIKDLNGLFNVDDLINKFKNYFFSKMILDATSVIDFASKEVLTTLANEIGPEKLIILLPSSPEPPLEFKKVLIDLKIYNFTTNIEDVIKFIEKPNTYEDAMKLIDNSFNSNVYVDNSIKEGEMPNENANEEFENNSNNMNEFANQDNQSSLGDILSNLNTVNSQNNYEDTNQDNYVESSQENQSALDYQVDAANLANIINNYSDNSDMYSNQNVDTNSNPNQIDLGVSNSDEKQNVFLVSDDYQGVNNDLYYNKPKKLVIGFQNVTSHAGCTSLIYMVHKMLITNMKKNVLSIEIGKNDFRLFRDNNMISANENNINDIINNANVDVILIDLNNYPDNSLCNDVLYLVEPTTIKLNELMATRRDIFRELVNKKVVLNKSLLSPNDIRTLASEAGMGFFYNIEPLNDRIFNDSISKLINMLGIK